MTEAPPEMVPAIEEVLLVAREANLREDRQDGNQLITDALGDFPTRAGCEGRETGALAGLCAAACIVIRATDTTGHLDHTPGEVTLDAVRTGTDEPTDPDAEMAGDPLGQGRLAALRMLVAWCNDDEDQFNAVFHAVADRVLEVDDAGVDEAFTRLISMVFTLVDMAGWGAVERDRVDGALSPEDQERLQARRRRDNADQRDSLPLDPRDTSPDDRGMAAPHGDALYSVTAYPRVPGARDRLFDAAHQQIEDMACRDGVTLCPERHGEDVEVWQLPHTLRGIARQQVRAAHRATGRHVALMRCWRHRGPVCPDTAPVVADDPLPLDVPGGGQ